MMKLSASALFLLLNSAAVGVSGQEPAACLTAVDTATDYFPTKVSPGDSASWNITYFKTYKIVANIDANETYLLYQCGSEPPQDEVASGVHKAVIEIPVAGVGIDVTPTIGFFEHLGLVDHIDAFTSDPQYISSPCLLESIAAGDVVVLQSKNAFADFAASPESSSETIQKLAGTVGFISPYNLDSPFNTTVKVSEYTETTNAAIFGWIKFYSAFFNLEATANAVFQAAQGRWNCVSENANRVQSDNPNKPVVLWAYYSEYCGGWDSGQCPNYYCEYAQQCSAELLSSTDGQLIDKCGSVYLTTEQLVALGMDADYWIYPSNDWNNTYALFKDQLDTMKSVQNMEVFDYQGSGQNAWFEQRYAEYFAVLQDFCSIVGTTASLADRSWFRNVMDGSKVGSLGQCTSNSRANSILPLEGTVCEDLNPSATNSTNGQASTSGASAAAVTSSFFALVAAAFFV
jgi:iron complex transport system substrate-binding protein